MLEVDEEYFKRHHYLLLNEEMKIVKIKSFIKKGNAISDGTINDASHIVWKMKLVGKVGVATFYVNGNTELRDSYKVGEVVELTIGDDDIICNNRMGLSKINDRNIEFRCDEKYTHPTIFKMFFYDRVHSDNLELIYDHLYSIRML